MAGGNTEWDDSKLVARAVLHDRTARRRIIGRMLMTALLLMAGGLWLVDGWLEKNPWFFLFWWGGCALLTCVVVLFALYDALVVIREERSRHR